MWHSIVVPLDGSRFAEYALPVAGGLAKPSGAQLRLVMVHEPAPALVPVAEVPVGIGSDDQTRRAGEQTYLAETALELGPVGSGPVSYQMLDGPAAPTIADAVTSNPPDLIVMATHGRGGLSRFWLGSVADHLVRHVSVPILLLRPQDGTDFPAAALRARRILVPLDLSSSSEAILGPAQALARLTQAHLTLFHVVEPLVGGGYSFADPIAVDPGLLEARRADAQEYLDKVADHLRAEGFAVATKAVVAMGVPGVIMERLDDYDLVAMSTKGAGGVRRLLVGSVADKVIRGSAKPVLVYRPKEEPAEGS